MIVQSRERFEGEFTIPGDKSITHRAVMLGGAACGETTVEGALIAEDTLATCRCMQALGAKIEVDGEIVRIRGTQEFLSGQKLNCGNSATTMRLLAGLLSGRGVDATLFGDASLSRRPMDRIVEPLLTLGAKVKSTARFAPILLSPSKLSGVYIKTEIPSAQVKSAILLAGLTADGKTTVEESVKTRDHTEKMLADMGAKIAVDGNRVTVERSELQAKNFQVPADVSSAAYLMALGALKGETLCKGVGVNPTRVGILKVFDEMQVNYRLVNRRCFGEEEVADILVEKSSLKAIELGGERIPSLIDELPLIALLCAFAEGESRICGAKELRVKESDRIKTTAQMIAALGGDCTETEDGFIIRGKKTLIGGRVDSGMDHRIAMTAAVGLAASKNGGEILRPECVSVSFPNFFKTLS